MALRSHLVMMMMMMMRATPTTCPRTREVGCGASWRRGIGLNKGPFLGEARDWVRPRARARGRAAVSRTDSRRELAAALVRRLGRHHARAARARALLAQADRHERGLGRHELRARVHHSRSRTVRATAARQPRKSMCVLERSRTGDTRAACCSRTLRATSRDLRERRAPIWSD